MSVASLVLLTPSHRAGSHRRNLVPWGPGSAGCTGVILAAMMAMGPTVVARFRFLGRTLLPRSGAWCHRWRRALGRQHFRELLVGHGEHALDVVSTKLATVSCWRTVVSLAATSARLSRAVPKQPIVAAGAGSAELALQSGSPPPVAWSWCWRLMWVRRNATFHALQVRLMAGRSSQLEKKLLRSRFLGYRQAVENRDDDDQSDCMGKGELRVLVPLEMRPSP